MYSRVLWTLTWPQAEDLFKMVDHYINKAKGGTISGSEATDAAGHTVQKVGV